MNVEVKVKQPKKLNTPLCRVADCGKHVYKDRRFCSGCEQDMRLGRKFVAQAQKYLQYRNV